MKNRILLLVCSLLFLFGTTAYADDAAAYKLTAVDTARRGDEITVALAVENSPGIAAMTAKVAYNKNVLELAKSENGTAFPIMDSNVTEDGVKLVWDGSLNEMTGTLSLATLTFKVKDDAAFGETAISVSGEASASDETNVPLTVANAAVTITHDHIWNDGTVTKEPTCVKAGEKTYTCTVSGCSETKTEPISATNIHERNRGVVTIAATCGTDGVKSYSCKVCGLPMGIEAIPATGNHTWGDWTTTKEATCSEEGEQSRKCEACGKTETGKLPMIDHTWNDGEITTQPDKDTDGVKTFTCTKCSATKTEKVPALNDHVWDAGHRHDGADLRSRGRAHLYLHDLQDHQDRTHCQNHEPYLERRREYDPGGLHPCGCANLYLYNLQPDPHRDYPRHRRAYLE